jgi:hypothetical protein
MKERKKEDEIINKSINNFWELPSVQKLVWGLGFVFQVQLPRNEEDVISEIVSMLVFLVMASCGLVDYIITLFELQT